MALGDRLSWVLREPLLHFLIAAALVFAVSALRGNTVNVGDRKIVVTAEQTERLASAFMQTWQRPPTAAELDGAIRDYIKEEIYYREALRLGLDKDDTVVRRRLRSKMEFLAIAEVENTTPSDAVLRDVLNRNPSKYAHEAAFSFDQIYVSTEGGDGAASTKSQAWLKRLKAGSVVRGDTISLPSSLEAASKSDIAKQFGDEFAKALSKLPQGEWSGPTPSGFGLHLVRVRKATAPSPPTLAQVRQAVGNDWRAETREKREAAAFQGLLDTYSISIEQPK